MTNSLMGKGYQDYVEGEHKLPPIVQNATPEQIKALKDWNQGSQKVMYWLSISIHDTMIGHIQDAESPKEAWDELVKQYETNTKFQKLQLKNKFNTISKKNLTINEYTLKKKRGC